MTKFVALQLIGNKECAGMRVLTHDRAPFELLDEGDPSKFGRALYYFLLSRGYTPSNDGRIEVLCFGAVPVELLVGLVSLPRWINFIGGIRNPYGMEDGSERVEEIVNYLINIGAKPTAKPAAKPRKRKVSAL
jgi:hypothetical protein